MIFLVDNNHIAFFGHNPTLLTTQAKIAYHVQTFLWKFVWPARLTPPLLFIKLSFIVEGKGLETLAN